MLEAITPHQIMGVGNALVSATGIGTVEISLPGSDATLNLHDVLFTPCAGVRLVSISQLDESGYCLSFHSGNCMLSDRVSGAILANSPKDNSHLYMIPGSCIHSMTSSISPSLSSSHSLPSSSSTHTALPSLIANSNLEMWHRRLGHANFKTVLDMAQTGVVTGMPANLSLTPQACDSCIWGKQTHRPVPKVHEGRQEER